VTGGKGYKGSKTHSHRVTEVYENPTIRSTGPKNPKLL